MSALCGIFSGAAGVVLFAQLYQAAEINTAEYQKYQKYQRYHKYHKYHLYQEC
jgi:hypothetical protein